MRTWVYGTLALGIVGAFLLWLLKAGYAMQDQAVASWLSVAGVLVGVATLASIAFAVIAFLATSGVRKEVEDARDSLSAAERGFLARMNEIQGAHYGVARATMKGMAEAFMSLKETEAFKAGLRCLRLAEIEVHLARETVESLGEGIQMAFKYSRRRFLDMEGEVWAKTDRMPLEERTKVRQYYLKLKDIMLGRMGV